jgi:hypothetical protein
MLRASALFLALLMLSACAPPTVRERLLTDKQFAPTAQVETLISWPTGRKFEKIAELEIPEGSATSDQAILDAFAAKAKALGADAIVWGARSGRGSTQVPVAGPVGVSVNAEAKTHAIAIKYLH